MNNAMLTSGHAWGGITIMETGQMRIQNGSQLLHLERMIDVRPGGQLVISEDAIVLKLQSRTGGTDEGVENRISVSVWRWRIGKDSDVDG